MGLPVNMIIFPSASLSLSLKAYGSALEEAVFTSFQEVMFVFTHLSAALFAGLSVTGLCKAIQACGMHCKSETFKKNKKKQQQTLTYTLILGINEKLDFY